MSKDEDEFILKAPGSWPSLNFDTRKPLNKQTSAPPHVLVQLNDLYFYCSLYDIVGSKIMWAKESYMDQNYHGMPKL